MEDREIIWVSKKFAEEYKALDKIKEQEASVKRIIEQKRFSLDEENELLSESLIAFKSVCLVHKKELQKVYEEQEEALYKMWEDMGDVSTKIHSHARDIADKTKESTNAINAMRKEIDTLKKTLSGLDVYAADNLVRLVKSIDEMDKNTKSILKFVLNNYKVGNEVSQ